MALGIPVGLRKAMRPGSRFDRATTLRAMTLSDTPAWWVASFATVLFVYQLPLFPFGALASSPRPEGATPQLLDAASYLALPALTIAVARLWGFASVGKRVRVGRQEDDGVDAARARGLPERRVFARQVLRPASPGSATMSPLLLVDSICGDFLARLGLARPATAWGPS